MLSDQEDNISFRSSDIGEFHNCVLGYIIDNTPTTQSSSVTNGKDSIIELYNLGASSCSSLVTFDVTTNYWSNSELYSYLDTSFAESLDKDVSETLNEMRDSSIITNAEVQFITSVFDNADDTIALQELQAELDTASYSDLAHASLDISVNSSQFWSNYEDDVVDIGPTALSPAHADLGGFIVGAGVYALTHRDDENIIANSIAAGAITGVCASAGLAGKIGRFLFG